MRFGRMGGRLGEHFRQYREDGAHVQAAEENGLPTVFNNRCSSNSNVNVKLTLSVQ